MEMSKMKTKGDSKKFKELVRQRMAKTGESYAVARAQLVNQRVKVATVGQAIADGKLVPRRRITTHPAADSTQLFKAMFGPKWEPPTKRCRTCHAWITFDGYCDCNAHERPTDVTEVVEIVPLGEPDEDDASTVGVKQQLEEWMALPVMPESLTGDSWYLATCVGCLPISTEAAEATGLYSATPFEGDEILLGEVTIDVEGEWRRHRLPIELGSWASDQVQDTFEGESQFPAFLAIRKVNDRYDVRVRPLRA